MPRELAMQAPLGRPAYAHTFPCQELFVSNKKCTACIGYVLEELRKSNMLTTSDLVKKLGFLTHRDGAKAIEDLVRHLDYYDHSAAAETLQEFWWDKTKKIFSVEHKESIREMERLVLLYEKHDHNTRALPMRSDLLRVQERILGLYHTKTMEGLRILYRQYRSVNHLERAEEIAIRALERYQKVYGHIHLEPYLCMLDLAEVLILRGRVNEVKSLRKRLLECCDEFGSRWNRQAYESRHSLLGIALAYRALGDRKEELLYLDVLVDMCRDCGLDPSTDPFMNKVVREIEDASEPVDIQGRSHRGTGPTPTSSSGSYHRSDHHQGIRDFTR